MTDVEENIAIVKMGAPVKLYRSKQMGDACEMLVAAELTLRAFPRSRCRGARGVSVGLHRRFAFAESV